MDLRQFLKFPDLEINRSPNNFGYYQNRTDGKRTTHFLMIGGTIYDKGYWYGKFLASALHYITHNLLKFSARMGLGSTGQKIVKEDFLQQAPEVFHNAGPLSVIELQGILDGCKDAGFPFEDERDVAIAMTFFEMNEAACCSACGIQPKLSLENTYQINSTEFPFPIKEQDNPTLLVYFPQDHKGNKSGNAVLSVSFAGLLGGVSAINEKGLSFGSIRSSNIRDPNSINGVPFVTLMSRALENASTVTEAKRYVESQSRTNAYYVVISDPFQQNPSLNLWFLGHKIFKTYEPGMSIDQSVLVDPKYSQYTPLTSAAYWMDMPVPGIEAGPEKPYRIIKERAGQIDDQQALEISHQLGSRFSVASSVFNLTQMHGWVAFANRKTPSHLDSYHYLDFKKIFSGYESFLNHHYHKTPLPASLGLMNSLRP